MSGFKGRKWPFQFLLLTLMSEPNVGTSGCLVKEAAAGRRGWAGVGKRGAKETVEVFFHCYTREKRFLEIVRYIAELEEEVEEEELQQQLCIVVLCRGCEDIYIRMTKTNSNAEKEELLTCRDFFDHLCKPSSSSSSSSPPPGPLLILHAASTPSYSLAWTESVAPHCCIVVSVGFRVCLVNATALRVKGRQGEIEADWGCLLWKGLSLLSVGQLRNN